MNAETQTNLDLINVETAETVEVVEAAKPKKSRSRAKKTVDTPVVVVDNATTETAETDVSVEMTTAETQTPAEQIIELTDFADADHADQTEANQSLAPRTKTLAEIGCEYVLEPEWIANPVILKEKINYAKHVIKRNHIKAHGVKLETPAVEAIIAEWLAYFGAVDPRQSHVGPRLTMAKFEEPVIQYTDDEVLKRLTENFATLEVMTNAAVDGHCRGLIVSGPAGVGKSYGIDHVLGQRMAQGDVMYECVKGFVRSTGLYKTLYENRDANRVIVFDDADAIFNDDISLNLLKAATDTTRTRKISWLAESKMLDEVGELIPRSFEFEGSIIFVTNMDFDKMIKSGHKASEHLSAMISRTHYLDVDIKTIQDYSVRIKQVVFDYNMLDSKGLTTEQAHEVVDFVLANADKMRDLSLRAILKCADLYNMGDNWQVLAENTLLRRKR